MSGILAGPHTCSYDAAGHLASISSSNTGGASMSYTYDSLNRLSTVVDSHLGRVAHPKRGHPVLALPGRESRTSCSSHTATASHVKSSPQNFPPTPDEPATCRTFKFASYFREIVILSMFTTQVPEFCSTANCTVRL